MITAALPGISVRWLHVLYQELRADDVVQPKWRCRRQEAEAGWWTGRLRNEEGWGDAKNIMTYSCFSYLKDIISAHLGMNSGRIKDIPCIAAMDTTAVSGYLTSRFDKITNSDPFMPNPGNGDSPSWFTILLLFWEFIVFKWHTSTYSGVTAQLKKSIEIFTFLIHIYLRTLSPSKSNRHTTRNSVYKVY